ncbi:MAG: hypothetical protein ABR985_19960 [Methanotrichaceae archaeon]
MIVKYNFSPETIEHPDRTDFLASGKILCRQRIETCRDSSFPYVTSSPDRLPQILEDYCLRSLGRGKEPGGPQAD